MGQKLDLIKVLLALFHILLLFRLFQAFSRAVFKKNNFHELYKTDVLIVDPHLVIICSSTSKNCFQVL